MKYFLFLIIGISTLAMISCATHTPPETFAAYKEGDNFKAISPDGVLYRVSEYEQESEASVDFWKDAFLLKMKNSNYKQEEQLSVAEIAYIFSLNEDLYLVAAIPKGKKITVIEASGKKEKFNQHKEQILNAIEKIKL
jgi:hypothetical protein